MIRIIIADDHILIRQGLKKLLKEAEDIEVVAECGDGAAALELIRKHAPDIAVLDVTMPKLDGISVAWQVAREMPSTKVVILTMHVDPEVHERAAAASVYGYVHKDDAFEELLDTIRVVYCMESIAPGPHSVTARKDLPTHREAQVLRLIANGCTNRMIANDLGISIKTVDTHRTNLMNKLNLHSTAELVRHALKSRLI
jgi:DNA-binding NarL/FixJ family response regulator